MITKIRAHLDGLPRAIELAASHVTLLAQHQVRHHPEPLLTDRARDHASARHLTMRGAIDWSFRLLSPSERRLFRWFAIFAGGCLLEAAEDIRVRERAAALTDPGALIAGDSRSILNQLDSLVGQSLLVREFLPTGKPHLRLLETIR